MTFLLTRVALSSSFYICLYNGNFWMVNVMHLEQLQFQISEGYIVCTLFHRVLEWATAVTSTYQH